MMMMFSMIIVGDALKKTNIMRVNNLANFSTAARWWRSRKLYSITSFPKNALCDGHNYESTSIRRPFDCLSKVIKVTVT